VDAAEAYRALAEFVSRDARLELATVARPASSDDAPEVRPLALADDAEAFFRDVAKTAVAGGTAPRLLSFDPLYKPDAGEVEWLPLDSVAAVQLAVDRASKLSAMAPFDAGDEDYKRRLAYWVATLTRASERACFFRAFTSSAELVRKRGEALVLRAGTFRKVEEHIFLFDEAIDCAVFAGFVFVWRKRDYRRIFDQMDEIRRSARAAAAALEQHVPLANSEEFIDACSVDSRMADKVLAIRSRDYFDRLSYDMLAAVIAEFRLDIPTRVENGVTKLVFESRPDRRFVLLKLMDDDYLRSSMTSHRYEVNSKTESGP
jgi:hypothetical protein